MSGWPITLPNDQIRRITQKHASVLILTRRLPLDAYGAPRQYDVHSGLVARRNQQHRKDGRSDLQTDPHVFAIEVRDVEALTLGGVDLKLARAAGHRTVEEFRADWANGRRLDLTRRVFAHDFTIVDARYLHRQSHKGYAYDPRDGMKGELPPVSAAEQEHFSRMAHARDAARSSEPLRAQRDQLARTLAEMREQLPSQSGPVRDSVRRLERELAVLNRKLVA